MKFRPVPVAFLAALALLGASSAALGVTTVSRSGTTITITGGDEINFVDQISLSSPGPLRYRDANGLNFGVGCIDVGDFTTECGDLGPGLVANVNLGGGNDTFRPDAVLTTSPVVVVDLGPGDDTMNGSGQNDTINGGAGVDNINGRGGQDTIDGGEGNDRLSGADGDDTITGGPGVDSLFGDGEYTNLSGYGNDTLKAQDGEVDSLSCQFGADTAFADANDVFDVIGECESRTIGSGAAPPPGPGPATGPLTVRLGAPSGTNLGPLASGKPMKFRMTFSGPCRVVAGIFVKKAEAKRLRLGTKDTTIAANAANVPSAGTFQGTLTIKKKFRTKLRGAARATVFLAIGCVGADGSILAEAPARKVVLRR